MSIYYGEHSIRFFPTEKNVEEYSFAGFNASGEHCSENCPDTWERWHLIPKAKPVFAPPGTEDSFITVPGRHGHINLTRYTFGKPVYKQRSGSITFLIDPDYIKHRATIHSEMTEYFQGQERLAVLRDDRFYYYMGTFTVQKIDPDKIGDEITLEYDLYPYKFERWAGGPWFWDDLDFETGVIRDYVEETLEANAYQSDTVIKVWPVDDDNNTAYAELGPGDRIVWNSEINGPTIWLSRDEPLYARAEDTTTESAVDFISLIFNNEEADDGLTRAGLLVLKQQCPVHAISEPATLFPYNPSIAYSVRNGKVAIVFPNVNYYGTLIGNAFYLVYNHGASVLDSPIATINNGEYCYDVLSRKTYVYNASGSPKFREVPEFSSEIRFWVDAKAMLDGQVCSVYGLDFYSTIQGLVRNYPVMSTVINSEEEFKKMWAIVTGNIEVFYSLPALAIRIPIYERSDQEIAPYTFSGIRYVLVSHIFDENNVTYYRCISDTTAGNMPGGTDNVHWEDIPEWSNTQYNTGNCVTFNGECYRCIRDIDTPTGQTPAEDYDNWQLRAPSSWNPSESYYTGNVVKMSVATRIPLFLSRSDAFDYLKYRCMQILYNYIYDMVGSDGTIASNCLEAVESYLKLVIPGIVNYSYVLTTNGSGGTLDNRNAVFDQIYEELLSRIRSIPKLYMDGTEVYGDRFTFVNIHNGWKHMSKADGLMQEIEIRGSDDHQAYVVFRNESNIMPDCMFGVHYRGKRL